MIKKIVQKIKDKRSEKAFANFNDNERRRRIEDNEVVIQAAMNNARFISQKKFCNSCKKFLNERGHLSEKQIEVLLNMSILKYKSKSFTHSYHDDYQYMDEFESGADFESNLAEWFPEEYFDRMSIPNQYRINTEKRNKKS